MKMGKWKEIKKKEQRRKRIQNQILKFSKRGYERKENNEIFLSDLINTINLKNQVNFIIIN